MMSSASHQSFRDTGSAHAAAGAHADKAEPDITPFHFNDGLYGQLRAGATQTPLLLLLFGG